MAYTKVHKSPFVKFFMSEAMMAELKTSSAAKGMTQQQVMRSALALYLDAMNERIILTSQKVVPHNVAPPRPPAVRRPI